MAKTIDPKRLDNTVLRRETIVKILDLVERGETEKAAEILRACLDFETRKGQYGRVMRAWRGYKREECSEAEYLAELERLL